MKSIFATLIEIKGKAEAYLNKRYTNAVMGRTLKGSYSLTSLPAIMIELIIGFSLAFIFAGTLSSSTTNSNAQNAVANVTNPVSAGLGTYWPLVVLVIFFGVVYVIARQTGLLGGKKKE